MSLALAYVFVVSPLSQPNTLGTCNFFSAQLEIAREAPRKFYLSSGSRGGPRNGKIEVGGSG